MSELAVDYCSSCGKSFQPGQGSCSRCGTVLSGEAMEMTVRRSDLSHLVASAPSVAEVPAESTMTPTPAPAVVQAPPASRPRMKVSRAINAFCYLLSGVVIIGLVVARPDVPAGWQIWLIALVSIAYGLYIGLTRRSYWVSTYTYLIPVLAVGYCVYLVRGH